MEVEAIQVETAAKVNLSLRVKTPDTSGMHPLLSLVIPSRNASLQLVGPDFADDALPPCH